MTNINVQSHDASKQDDGDVDSIAYLQAAFEDGNTAVIINAIGNLARVHGMSRIARETGLGRANLYRALSPEGNPEFVTILKVIKALGLRFSVDNE